MNGKKINVCKLPSPDDIDANYRKKRSEYYIGQTGNVTVTENHDNELNLLTDVTVCHNNTDDREILNERIDTIVEKTPDMEELHNDGADGCEDNEKKMEELEITHVQTAVRGRMPEGSIEIDEVTDGRYEVKCPHQCVSLQKTKTRHKACFDAETCKQCPFNEACPAKQQGDKRVFYFDRSDYLLGKRNRNIKSLPPERRKLRPNVEATVKEFTKPFNHKGKLRVRGLFKMMVYALAMAISINFGRVWRYIAENPDFFALSNLLFCILPNFFARNSQNGLQKIIIRDKSRCWLEPQQYFKQAA